MSGVTAIGASSVILEGGRVNNNGQDGIQLNDSTVVAGWGTSAVTSNAGFGAWCAAPPAVPQMRLPALTFSGNVAGASNCPGFVP